jgi:hypothetical protein
VSDPRGGRDGSRSPVRADGGRDEPPADEESDEATSGFGDDGPSGESTGDEGTETRPLDDLARRVDGRSDRPADADAPDEFDELLSDEPVVAGDTDELFEEMDVSDVDSEAVWDSVLDDDTEPVGVASRGTPENGVTEEGLGAERDERSADDEPTETVVPKRSYCESCYFFADPPEATCTYSGAEIVEIVDSDRFKVTNCPVVAGFVDTDGTAATGDGDDGDNLASESGSDD